MIDTTTEQLVTFHEAAALLPSNPHPGSVWRWTRRGVRGVKLDAVMVGGKRYTSREALERFLRATNEEEKRPSANSA